MTGIRVPKVSQLFVPRGYFQPHFVSRVARLVRKLGRPLTRPEMTAVALNVKARWYYRSLPAMVEDAKRLDELCSAQAALLDAIDRRPHICQTPPAARVRRPQVRTIGLQAGVEVRSVACLAKIPGPPPDPVELLRLDYVEHRKSWVNHAIHHLEQKERIRTIGLQRLWHSGWYSPRAAEPPEFFPTWASLEYLLKTIVSGKYVRDYRLVPEPLPTVPDRSW